MITKSFRLIGAGLLFAWVTVFSIPRTVAENDGSDAAGRPNILWIVAEDIGLHMGGDHDQVRQSETISVRPVQ